MRSNTYRDVTPLEAAEMVREGAVHVLDVRTVEEYRSLGHVPGATLLPLNLLAAGLATFLNSEAPLLVLCEHGVRSVAAAEFLTRAGFLDVLNMVGGMAAWTGPREFDAGTPCGPQGPCSWLLECADLLPPRAAVLDLACGRGRHALLLATANYDVLAVDNNAECIATLRATAEKVGIPLRAEVLDLEADAVELPEDSFEVIIGVHYLHRPLFPALVKALRPGGLLLYETFTVEQGRSGRRPSNPAYLLNSGELPELVSPLEVLRQREGEFEGRWVASVAARKGPK